MFSQRRNNYSYAQCETNKARDQNSGALLQEVIEKINLTQKAMLKIGFFFCQLGYAWHNENAYNPCKCLQIKETLPLREGLTFDDVLLIPKRSPIISRSQTELKTRLSKSITLNIPLISANMDTVT